VARSWHIWTQTELSKLAKQSILGPDRLHQFIHEERATQGHFVGVHQSCKRSGCHLRAFSASSEEWLQEGNAVQGGRTGAFVGQQARDTVCNIGWIDGSKQPVDIESVLVGCSGGPLPLGDLVELGDEESCRSGDTNGQGPLDARLQGGNQTRGMVHQSALQTPNDPSGTGLVSGQARCPTPLTRTHGARYEQVHVHRPVHL